jgi:MHS family proline/betaine transporter-like MFS transporter
MRPIGGMITGTKGDMQGRKGALVMSMVMMAIPTFAMGCLSSYEKVGWVSTLLLVVCRLLQGLSVGGQLPSSLVFTVERQPKENWGYYGALVIVSFKSCWSMMIFVSTISLFFLTKDILTHGSANQNANVSCSSVCVWYGSIAW